LPWQDVLHEGPVPAGPRPSLLRARADFLADCGWGSRRAILSALERRDRQYLEALRVETQVVLWFEHDLFDQLQLVDALAIAHEAGGAPQLIVVGAFPGRPAFRGLGELGPEELETLWPARQVATGETLAAATAVWAALRAPEPDALAQLAREGSPGLPFLRPALGRLLEELPAPEDGLSGTERRTLQAIEAGTGTPAAAFLAAQDLEEAPFQGDTWFFRTLGELGRGRERLVETRDGDELPPAPPLGDGPAFTGLALRLTRRGEQVLRGEVDRVELLGIDRWLGGMHLRAETVRRWDPAERRLR
jgi:hypothetical protein